MKYIIYQITNNVNSKIYIGCHKTSNVNDNYMGSGIALNHAYKKYGKKNFTKEILHVFDSAEEMFDKETELVNESFVQRSDTYNNKIGGFGGWDHVNNNGDVIVYAAKGREKQKWLSKNDPEWARRKSEKISASISGENNPQFGKVGTFRGKNHTEETKAKIGAANSQHQKGKNNSQYGTCWIHNNNVSKKINKDELDAYLIEGWIKGRKMKF